MEAERASQFLRFCAGKIGHDHRDLQHLLLKKRHAYRALEHRLQALVEISDRLLARAPREIRMHHVALDRSRPNDRDLDDDVVKTFRLHPRQRRHLRAALDLKNADRVRLLHQLESRGVVLRKVREIERPAAFATERERVLHHRHHAEAEQVDLHDPEIFAIVLVPLRDDAAGHGGILQRHDRAQFALADNHPAGVLPEMARQAVDRLIQPNECGHARVFVWQTGLLDLRLQIQRVREIAVGEEMRETIENVRRKIERLADLARRAPSRDR